MIRLRVEKMFLLLIISKAELMHILLLLKVCLNDDECMAAETGLFFFYSVFVD